MGVLPWPCGRSTRSVVAALSQRGRSVVAAVGTFMCLPFVRGWVQVGCAERWWRVNF